MKKFSMVIKGIMGLFVLLSIITLNVNIVNADLDEIVSVLSTLKAGPIEIHPRLKLAAAFDTNIYLSSTPVGSAIFTLSPGVGLKLPLGEHSITAGYHMDGIIYTQKPEQNNVIHHTLGVGGGLSFAGGLKVNLNDAFTYTTDPATSELTDRIKRSQNLVSADLAYNTGNRLSFGAGISNALHKYDDLLISKSLDRTETSIVPTVSFQLLPKTTLGIDYTLGMIGYQSSKGKDSLYHQVRAGTDTQILPKTTLSAKIGIQIRDYADAAAKDIGGAMVANISAIVTPVEMVTLNLGLGQGVVESAYATNLYFASTDIRAGISARVMEKLAVNVDGSMTIGAYPEKAGTDPEARKDTILGVNVGADYDVQEWLFAGAKLEFKNRSSNISKYGYTDIKVGANIGARF